MLPMLLGRRLTPIGHCCLSKIFGQTRSVFMNTETLIPLRGFPPIATKRLGITTNLGAIGGVLWHRNSDSVVICVPITTHKLCCNIYFLCCNRVMLMQPFLSFVLQLVGNTATPFLSCISMSCVVIERCYGDHTSVGCF